MAFYNLKSEIKFLRVASKSTYFHEEIKFLCQQLETALPKQRNSNIGFCNNSHGKHIRSNIVNSDDSIIMTDYHTKATGNDNNKQADSYINNENTENHQQKIHKKIIRHCTFPHEHSLSIRKKYLH